MKKQHLNYFVFVILEFLKCFGYKNELREKIDAKI